MNKALNYMALARKAGRIELGEEPVGAVARAGKAKLVIVASDSGDHTWRRALSFTAGTSQSCVKVPATKEEMGQAVGRQSLALAAFTDPALALAFLKALEQPDTYREALSRLEDSTRRVRQHQLEEKAHKRNVKLGRHKGETKQK